MPINSFLLLDHLVQFMTLNPHQKHQCEVQYLKSCPIIFQQAHSENQSIASDQHPQQHVSAEIHVQVHEDNEEESRNLNFDEDTASMPELEDHIPEVMVTSRSPGSDDSK